MFEVDLVGYQIEDSSVRLSSDGFQCCVYFGVVSDEQLGALSDSAGGITPVRLVFADRRAIVIDRITVEQVRPGWVRIIGRVVEAPSREDGDSTRPQSLGPKP